MTYVECMGLTGWTPATFSDPPRIVGSPNGPRLSSQSGPRLRAIGPHGEHQVPVAPEHQGQSLTGLWAIYSPDGEVAR